MDDLNCATYKSADGEIVASACASGDAKITFDPSMMNAHLNHGFNVNNISGGTIVDKPWYQDVLDWLSGPAMINGATVTVWQLIMLICFASACAVLVTVVMSKYTSVGALSADMAHRETTDPR